MHLALRISVPPVKRGGESRIFSETSERPNSSAVTRFGDPWSNRLLNLAVPKPAKSPAQKISPSGLRNMHTPVTLNHCLVVFGPTPTAESALPCGLKTNERGKMLKLFS